MSLRKSDHRIVVGAAIRKHRLQAGLSQEKLAENAELHHNFIGGVERGIMDISIGSLMKIAKALKVRPCDLIKEL